MDALNFHLLILLLFFSCGKNLTYLEKAPNNKKVASDLGQSEEVNLPLPFIFLNSEGKEVDLNQHNRKPTLLIFSGPLCESCDEQDDLIKSKVTELNVNQLKINFYSILVNTDLDSCKAWKEEKKISWNVLCSQGIAEMKLLCSAETTPCLVVHDPKSTSTLAPYIFKNVGITSIEELEKYTGSWF